MHIGFISKGRCVGRTYLMIADSVIRGTPIVCAECEVHCSVERAKKKAEELKGDKENDIQR